MATRWCFLLVLLNLAMATERPIIGILAQELEPDDPFRTNYTSYMAASYVKAVEASGARAVPVFIRRDVEYYRDLASKVNGFLYTGGNSDLLSHYGIARSGNIVLDVVLEMNKKGDIIPLLGVCQGMELLAILSNGWKQVLSSCSVENEVLSLQFLHGFRNSSLYKDASEEDIRTLSEFPSTSNHHGLCLSQKNLTLFNLSQWRVLSMSKGAKSRHFVSSMEWDALPIAAVQFHPEKSPYEWKPKQANPHDARSVAVSRLFYDWLVAQARLNNHSFPNSREEQDSLIYNFSPIYTGERGMYDTQDYYFIDPPGILENALFP